jgi:hypothetical protein
MSQLSPTPFITAVEVQRPATRLLPLRRTGTLRHEDGHLAFEGSDGRTRVRVPLAEITDVVAHRSGHGFWLRVDGRRLFIVPRRRPRPGGYNPLHALTRPVATVRFLWALRGQRELARRWLDILDPDGGPARRAKGLPRAVRLPMRVTFNSVIVMVLPAYELLSLVGQSA